MASKTRQRKVGKGSTETGKVDTATEEDDIQWELICPICTDEIRDAVVAGDTHTYCRGCIKQWFKSCSDRKMPLTSPSTRETIGGKLLESASPLDTHFQAAGANIASILKLRESFSQLDPLRDVLAASLEGWQPPQVVMIGDESSGKSTILERLAMMPIFPRGDDLTTRLPIHLRLRYAEVSLPPRLEVIESATGKTVRGPYVIPSVSGHVDVRQQMDAIIQEEKRGQRGVSSTRCIVLHVASRHVPSIDLVDLPGLVATGVSSAETRALVEEHIRLNDARSIYLLTCPASVAPNTSLAVDIVVKHNLQARTIGIFTMCDEASSARQRNLLVQRLAPDAPAEGGVVRLEPHGWVAAMNEPLGEEPNAFKRLRQQALAEARWFEGVVPATLSGRAGCGAVMKRLGALFNGYLHQSWGPTTVTMVEAKLEETLVAEVLLGRPALRGEPALARSLAMEETRRMLGSEATLQGLDRVLASLYQPLRFHIEEELKGCMEQRSVHAFIKEWTARRAAVARLCATAAADWPKLLADAVVRELEKRPEAPADMEGRRALREAPPFVLSRFPTFVKALGEELLAHFEEQATVALAAVERSVGPFFEGFCSSARPQFPNVDVDDAGNPRQDATVVPVVEMVPVSEDTAGQNVAAPNPYGHAYGCGCAHCAQHARQVAPVVQPGRALGGAARLADGVAFAFMRALTVTECPDDVLARAAAALGDADWDEASALAEQREKAVARREQLERVLAGIVEMLGEPGDAGVFVFPVRELKHVRSFGAGQLICSGGVAVDLVGNVFAKHVHNPTHVMVFNSGGTHVAWCTQGLSDVLGLARDGQGNIIISSGNKTFAVFGGGVQLCQFLRSINVSQSAPTLRSPHGMAVDSAGNIWVAELNLNQVIVLAPDGTFIKAVGASQLEKPSGVALDQGGNLYVTEVGKQRVSVFSPDGKLTRRFGEGPHLSANLGGVAVDGAGCVLVVDRGMRRVAMFGPHGRFVSSFGNGLLVGPDCLAVDAAGQVFVTDNNQIQVFA